MVEKIYNGIREKVDKASLLDIMVASNSFGRGLSTKKMQPMMDEYPDLLTSQDSVEEKVKKLQSIKGIGLENAKGLVNNIPAFMAFLEETGLQGKLPNRILLDTGAGHVLLVEADVADSLQFKYADQRVNLGKGLNGPIIGRWGRVPSLAIGPWSWLQVPAIFPDSMARKSAEPWQASLGGEFFRRFKLTFHYLDQYVVMKPIGNQWKKDFEYGMSGIGLRAIGPAYRRFIVETIHAGSPADEAGILPGDGRTFFVSLSAKL
jgi:hypothetical protein